MLGHFKKHEIDHVLSLFIRSKDMQLGVFFFFFGVHLNTVNPAVALQPQKEIESDEAATIAVLFVPQLHGQVTKHREARLEIAAGWL